MKKHNFRRKRRGVALLEMALTIPVLIALVFGMIDFSVFANNTLKLANATREGARSGAVGAPVAKIRQRVKDFSGMTLSDSNIKVEYSPSASGGSTYLTLTDVTGGLNNAASADDYIRVTTSTNNTSVTGALAFIFNRKIEKQVIMRRERTS